MKKSDMDKFVSNMNARAAEIGDVVGRHMQAKIHTLPDARIVNLAREGNELAREEADRRGLNW